MQTQKILKNLAYVLIGAGVLVFLFLLASLWPHFSLKGSNVPDMDVTGQFGDFFGGVVGSLWALAGVLLLFVTLHEQQKSSAKASKEFLLSRAYDVVFRKVDDINTSVNQLEFNPGDLNSKGIAAMIQIGALCDKHRREDDHLKLLPVLSQSDDLRVQNLVDELFALNHYAILLKYKHGILLINNILALDNIEKDEKNRLINFFIVNTDLDSMLSSTKSVVSFLDNNAIFNIKKYKHARPDVKSVHERYTAALKFFCEIEKEYL